MIFSTKYSYLVLRIGLAIVFFWFGVDTFLRPGLWYHVWIPDSLMYIGGIFEVLIGLSMLSGVFMRFFSILGIMFLIGVVVTGGVSEITVQGAGLIGSLLAIVLWPERDH